jgi:Skp family chaperone for outer membrane proteins
MLPPSMTPAVQNRLRDLLWQVRFTHFVRAAAAATLALGAAFGSALLLARLTGAYLAPSRHWCWALVVPVAFGIFEARRRAPSTAALAAWLDRRGGLGGLLVASREAEGAEWDAELDARLAAAAVPALAPARRKDGWRTLLGLALVAGVAFLPAPVVAGPKSKYPAMAAAVEELKRELEELKKHDALDEKTAEELEKRLDELKEKMDRGEPVAWSEIDRVEQRMEERRQLKEEATETARQEMAAAAAGAGQGDAASTAERMSKALEKAAQAGALDGLPQALKDKLGLGKGEGKNVDDAALAKLTPEELQKLAEELAKALAGELEDLAASGLVDPEAAKKLAAAGAGEWEEADDHVHTVECEGGT